MFIIVQLHVSYESCRLGYVIVENCYPLISVHVPKGKVPVLRHPAMKTYEGSRQRIHVC
jgi:hypothetical protein